MGLLTSIHEDTPTHPKLNPEVMAHGRAVEQARAALSDIERRARELELDRDSHDELHVLMVARKLADLRARYLEARVALSQAQRTYDEAFQHAQIPWQQYAREKYREAATRFLKFLETEALPANDAMLAAQAAAAGAGVCVEPLHLPQLTPDAVEHRCRVGRQGLG